MQYLFSPLLPDGCLLMKNELLLVLHYLYWQKLLLTLMLVINLADLRAERKLRGNLLILVMYRLSPGAQPLMAPGAQPFPCVAVFLVLAEKIKFRTG